MIQNELDEMVETEHDEENQMASVKTEVVHLEQAASEGLMQMETSSDAVMEAAALVDQIQTAKGDEMHQQDTAVKAMHKAISHCF